MAESLDSLLSKREQAKETEKDLTKQIISEAEKYILSALCLGLKVTDSRDMSQPSIVKAVQNLYDPRLEQRDITSALSSLVSKKILRVHRLKYDDYSLASGEFGDVPVIEYLSEAEAKKRRNESPPF